MHQRCALGLDYGTNSCRSLLIDLTTGEELGSSVFPYPSGQAGILLDPSQPHLARQNPQDYLDGLVAIITGAIAQALAENPGFDPASIIGIGIDTTGSTVIPVDQSGTPLGLLPEFSKNLAAMVWLWRDHTSHAEAAEITALAARIRPEHLAKCGGTYSSEWFWSKILHLKRTAPDVFHAAHSFVEHCDYLPAVLCGLTDPLTLPRGICAAGHKAMFNPAWGGLPDKDFLTQLDPALADLRDRLYNKAVSSDQPAGRLTGEWAAKLGLRPGIAVAVGAFDAHMGAVGAGIKEGTLVKILGTSTCDLMIHSNQQPLADIPGLCGIVDGSVLPGNHGLEAGQSAVGDIFLWFVNNLVPDSYGATPDAKFQAMEAALAPLLPGQTGLLALDWNNGNRTILTDTRLTGLILGQTLHTRAHEIYRALIEATAFGALTIINRLEEYGVPVLEVVNTGGLAVKNAALMQIYADVIGRPMKISRSDQTCALGAAIFGAISAGTVESGYDSVADAQRALCRLREKSYQPNPGNHARYARLYGLYRQLHDAFGTQQWSGRLSHVMKELLALREEVS
ncbi:MAG: araB [Verrucomicrobiales bacterium]|nr:araB [Verrucomicrobiales bacterium]